MNLPSVQHLLRKYEIHPSKALGQNFLTAVPTLEKIVDTLNPKADEKVLEIGPGLGLMTRILADKAHLVAAVEMDPKMVRILQNEWEAVSNIMIIQGDILRTNLEKLCGGKLPWVFAGNIPYNISTPILFHLRDARQLFTRGVLTMQKEVADRLAAAPGSKDYGILSILIQAVADIDREFLISAESFYPAPKVESALVSIHFHKTPKFDIKDEKIFANVVKAAFGTRRKMLKNAMSTSPLFALQPHIIAPALEAAGIEGTVRAEELSIEDFARLSNEITSRYKH